MKKIIYLLFGCFLASCSQPKKADLNIIFLHHSTGSCIWKGKYKPSLKEKIASKISKVNSSTAVPILFKKYAEHNKKSWAISELNFPQNSPYGWKNYPYDYYNIWVKNAGNSPYLEEPTLEILTQKYGVIIFKHCFPVSEIETSSDTGDINSPNKTLANYKLQYLALREKMQKFPDTKFVLWTPSALVKNSTTEEMALNTNSFYNWILNEWDLNSDNIYLWDFYGLETEGELYLKNEYATNDKDSHPNPVFSEKASALFVNRLIDIIESNGSKTNNKGEKIGIP